MRITKFVHACLLVETDRGVAIFDPGVMSTDALDDWAIADIGRLDDLVITHSHADHFSPELVQKLVKRFPEVHITAPSDVVEQLAEHGISASQQASDGIELFEAPHEAVEPLFPTPSNLGVHYHGLLTHPGDSHNFAETKAVLALPVSGPWANTVYALNLALQLKPRYVVPIHDWHWHDQARASIYAGLKAALAEQGITLLEPETGKPIDIQV